MTDRADALRALINGIEGGQFDGSAKIWDNFPCDDKVRAYMDASAAFRGSLDAAKALHEAVLPSWEWDVSCTGGEKGQATARLNMKDDSIDTYWLWIDHEVPARAWLLAILRALLSMEGEA